MAGAEAIELPPEADPEAGPEKAGAQPDSAPVAVAATRDPSRRQQRPVYRYGNYAGYYGYRVGAVAEDHRLLALRSEWFRGRRCLDIGCNEGLVPLTLAVRFQTASVQGVDIDGSLVRRAGRNLRSMQRLASEAAAEAATLGPGGDLAGDKAALAAAVPALEGVTFTRGNVLDVPLTGSFDTILCLSVTKWVHLNWGDDGLKRLFSRAFDLLVPGGLLIVEPQPWKSYSAAFHKQKMPDETRVHYRNVVLRPAEFAEHLRSVVGFARVEQLREGAQTGFDRPLLVCYKPTAV